MNHHKYFLLTHFEYLDVDIIKTIAKLSVYKKFRMPFYKDLKPIDKGYIYDDNIYISEEKYYTECIIGDYQVHITVKNNQIYTIKILYLITIDFAKYVKYHVDFDKSYITPKYLTIEPIEMNYFGGYKIEYSDKLNQDGLYVIYAKKNQRIHFEYKID